MSRSIGLLGDRPGPLRRWGRMLIIAVTTGIVFAVGVALMAIVSA